MKRILLFSLSLILLLSLSAFAQDAQKNLTFIVAGQPGQAPIVQINGKSYVDIEAMARFTNSSLSFKGNQVILTPQGSPASMPAANPEPSASAAQVKLVAVRQPVDPEPEEPAAKAKPAADEGKHIPASEEEWTAALAKAAQNPVADMISFPLQNNTAFGYGPNQRVQDVLNIQPVIPLHLTQKWNLITRTILPIVWQPNASQPTGQGWYGLGDLNPSLFFSPAKSGKLIWGVDQPSVLPTATAPQLGQGKVSAGPGIVGPTPRPLGRSALWPNNVWSLAGTGAVRR